MKYCGIIWHKHWCMTTLSCGGYLLDFLKISLPSRYPIRSGIIIVHIQKPDHTTKTKLSIFQNKFLVGDFWGIFHHKNWYTLLMLNGLCWQVVFGLLWIMLQDKFKAIYFALNNFNQQTHKCKTKCFLFCWRNAVKYSRGKKKRYVLKI